MFPVCRVSVSRYLQGQGGPEDSFGCRGLVLFGSFKSLGVFWGSGCLEFALGGVTLWCFGVPALGVVQGFGTSLF